jgi:hypothetical protein
LIAKPPSLLGEPLAMLLRLLSEPVGGGGVANVALRFDLSAADRLSSRMVRSLAVGGVDLPAVDGDSFLEEVLRLDPKRVAVVDALGDLVFSPELPSEMSVDTLSFLPDFLPLPSMREGRPELIPTPL